MLTKKWFRTYIYTKQMHLWLQPGKIRIHFKRIYFLFETISEETILDSFSVSIFHPREDYSLCEWLLRLPSKKLRSSPAHTSIIRAQLFHANEGWMRSISRPAHNRCFTPYQPNFWQIVNFPWVLRQWQRKIIYVNKISNNRRADIRTSENLSSNDRSSRSNVSLELYWARTTSSNATLAGS